MRIATTNALIKQRHRFGLGVDRVSEVGCGLGRGWVGFLRGCGHWGRVLGGLWVVVVGCGLGCGLVCVGLLGRVGCLRGCGLWCRIGVGLGWVGLSRLGWVGWVLGCWVGLDRRVWLGRVGLAHGSRGCWPRSVGFVCTKTTVCTARQPVLQHNTTCTTEQQECCGRLLCKAGLSRARIRAARYYWDDIKHNSVCAFA